MDDDKMTEGPWCLDTMGNVFAGDPTDLQCISVLGMAGTMADARAIRAVPELMEALRLSVEALKCSVPKDTHEAMVAFHAYALRTTEDAIARAKDKNRSLSVTKPD